MRRAQHLRIRRVRNMCIVFLFIIMIMVVVAGGLFTKFKMPTHEVTKTSKHINDQHALNQVNQDIFSKKDVLAVKIDQQLKSANYIGTALIVHHDRIILQKGYGYADSTHNRLNDAKSMYQMASLQKSFTATMIMQQVEAGKLALDTLLSQYYPNIPNANRITIRQLLTMTSGLKQITVTKMFADEADNISFDASHTAFLGTQAWSYQPINYRLLAGILMQITHKTYGQLFNETFNQKLGLNVLDYAHFITNSRRTIGYRAQNYSKYWSNDVTAYSLETGTGNMAITAGSLYRYYRLLIDHKIIMNQSNAEAMWQPAKGTKYASGLYHYPTYMRGHGIIRGFEPTVLLSKDGKEAVILLSNQHEKHQSWQKLANQLFTQTSAIQVTK
ncbi:serine hydrolase [Leuconostoc carnosum]|nr:serine hydrolase [Leuconostoc carnosum]QEA33815.1 serine hydrolase [Leuconostoc carnosum]